MFVAIVRICRICQDPSPNNPNADRANVYSKLARLSVGDDETTQESINAYDQGKPLNSAGVPAPSKVRRPMIIESEELSSSPEGQEYPGPVNSEYIGSSRAFFKMKTS